jgi:signal transduction histidine kinase
MNDAAPEPEPAHPLQTPEARLSARLTRRPLAIRLAWLTVIAVLLAEAAFVGPSLVRRRGEWLNLRVTEAQLAALSAAVAPGGNVDPATRAELLHLAGSEAIRLEQPGRATIVLSPSGALPAAAPLDLRDETAAQAVMRTGASLMGEGADRLVGVISTSPLNEAATVTTIVHAERLHQALLTHMRRFGTISLTVAVAVGLLLYLALLLLLVRPMRRLTESIAAFRADPERSTPFDVPARPFWREDEISAAARELAAMQRELRAALWRNARLAALGTAVAKVNHDLRGILSPAMLTAERLQNHGDPGVKRAGDILMRAVERATELTRRTLDFTGEMPTALPRQRVILRQTVDDATEQARAACPWLTVANLVPPSVCVAADRESLARVFGNLLRNAGEATARRVTVAVAADPGDLCISVTDDGPGLPDAVRARLFSPFVAGGRRGSTGLGLAIVHDLMRAHGGDAVLLDTGPGGTHFRLTLPARLVVAAPGNVADAHSRA